MRLLRKPCTAQAAWGFPAAKAPPSFHGAAAPRRGIGAEHAGEGMLCCAVSALGLAAVVAHRRRRQLQRAGSRVRRAQALGGMAASVTMPTDYYGLLGLPRFGATRDDVRKAYRRVVKLVHPDILGGDTTDLTGLVTLAYQTLANEAERATYDDFLQLHDPIFQEGGPSPQDVESGERLTDRHSTWAPDSPAHARPVFVDERDCVMCVRCVECAPDTFAMDNEGTGRARAFQQCGDSLDDIDWAIKSCPTGAIAYVDRGDLKLLELFMPDCYTDGHLPMPERFSKRGSGPYDLLRMYRSGASPSRESVAYTDGWRRGRRMRQEGEARRARVKDPKMVAHSIQTAIEAVPEEVAMKVWGKERSCSGVDAAVSEP